MQPPEESYSENPQQIRLAQAPPVDPPDGQQWNPSTSLANASVQPGFDPAYIPPHYAPYAVFNPDTSPSDPFDVASWSQQATEQFGQSALEFGTGNNDQTAAWRQMGFLGQSPAPHSQPTPASIGPIHTPQQCHIPHPSTATPHPCNAPTGIYTPSLTHHSTPVGSTDFSDTVAHWPFMAEHQHQPPDPYAGQQLVLPPAAYPSPLDPVLTVAVDNAASTVGPMSARSKLSTEDYLNFPQSASTSRSHMEPQHHPITPLRLTPTAIQHSSPLSISTFSDQTVYLGTESLAKRGGKPKSLGIKRKLPEELRFSHSPSTLAPPQPLPMSLRSHSFSEGSRAIAHTPFRDSPMTARSLPAHIEEFSPHIRSIDEGLSVRTQSQGPLRDLADINCAVASRIKSFNEDMTSIIKSVPRSVFLQPADENSEQQAQLANLLEMVNTIQSACARLHVTDQSGNSALLWALRQQQLASPFASSSRHMTHRNSIISIASDLHSPHPPNLKPIGPEITAIKMSHDITLWHNGAPAPPPHEYPSVAPPHEPVRDLDPATIHDPHPPPDKMVVAPPPPEAPPISSAPPAPVPNLLFGAWHPSEIDRLCHIWLLKKRDWLTDQGIDFTDWCGTIPEKMLTCRVLMTSPAHQYMVSLNEIARARPGYVPPPPDVYDSPPSSALPLNVGLVTGVHVGADPNVIGASAQHRSGVSSNVRPNPTIPVEDNDTTIGQEAQRSKDYRVGCEKGRGGHEEARAKLNPKFKGHGEPDADEANKPWPLAPPLVGCAPSDDLKPQPDSEIDHRRKAAEGRAQELVEALSRTPSSGVPATAGTHKVLKKYRIDEGIDWVSLCDRLGISRSKNQIMFRAVEWGLKERERRNIPNGKKKKKLSPKLEDDTHGPSQIHGLDLTAIKAKGDTEEIDHSMADIRQRAAESFLLYDPTSATITELPDGQAEPRRRQNANMPEFRPKSKGTKWASPSSPGGGTTTAEWNRM